MRPVEVSSPKKRLPIRVRNVRERKNESVVTVLNYMNIYILCVIQTSYSLLVDWARLTRLVRVIRNEMLGF